MELIIHNPLEIKLLEQNVHDQNNIQVCKKVAFDQQRTATTAQKLSLNVIKEPYKNTVNHTEFYKQIQLLYIYIF